MNFLKWKDNLYINYHSFINLVCEFLNCGKYINLVSNLLSMDYVWLMKFWMDYIWMFKNWSVLAIKKKLFFAKKIYKLRNSSSKKIN